MKARLTIWPMLVVLAAACGTVAGNPKKPGPTPPPSAIVYQLPLIEFSVPEDATADDPALNLTASYALTAQDEGSKTIVSQWGKRVMRIVRHVDDFTRRLNKIVEKEEVLEGETLRFSGRGDGKLSGVIEALPEGDAYSYRARLCYDGKPFQDFRWSKDGQKIELAKDLSAKTDGGEDALAILTRVRVEKKDGAVNIDVANEGSYDDQDADQEKGIVERAIAARGKDGGLTLRVVFDRFTARPEAFTPDAYLVGRLSPRNENKAAFDTEFVGYFAGYKNICKNGFDENAADLWAPDRDGPRFCIGRPSGKRRFDDFEEYLATIKRLEPIGILKASDLGVVALPGDIDCP